MNDSLDISQRKGIFRAGEDGLFALKDGGIERPVCEPIWHVGNAIRVDGTGAADVIEFIDRAKTRKRTLISHKDSVVRSTKVFETLADQNFAVPENKAGRELLLAYLAGCRASSTMMYLLAHRMGWHGQSFVIGNDVISTDTSKSLILDGPIKQYAAKFDQKGILSDYQSKVLRRASHSSRLMTGIALALLVPLARIIGLENGGLNIVGPAATGKTTILRVIGSFYGGGTSPYIESWLMTDNAPATLGFAHCDLPLLLDESDALEPDQTKAGSRLKALVHRLALGQQKAQSHRALGDDSMLTDFHVIFGSTSEHRLAAFMRQGGSAITGGLAARLVDVPADAGKGLKIFEKLPRDVTADQYLQRLNRACHLYCGVAGRTYLGRLVTEVAKDGRGLEAFLADHMRTFENKIANDPQVDPRIRRRFAALFAAGQLGLRYGVLHPSCDWFMDAIASCYRAAIASQPGLSISAPVAIARLIKYLDDNIKKLPEASGKQPITKSTWRRAIGLRSIPAQHGRRIWLKSKVLRDSIFPDDSDIALGHLANAGVLVKSKAEQQRVPELKIKEYFYIFDSKKLNALREPKEE